MLTDDRDGLGGSDVVSRAPVFLARDGIEVFLNDLLYPRESSARHIGRLWQIGERHDYGSVIRRLFLRSRPFVDLAAFEPICERR
jgi:hypothetical protein